MSLSLIHSFEYTLYETLKNKEIVSSLTSSIYLSIQQNAKQPFILVNIEKITNVMNICSKYYEIDFQICIFDNQKTKSSLLKIAGAVSEVVIPYNLQSNIFFVISTNFITSEFIKGQDLLTTKLVLNYKALLMPIKG